MGREGRGGFGVDGRYNIPKEMVPLLGALLLAKFAALWLRWLAIASFEVCRRFIALHLYCNSLLQHFQQTLYFTLQLLWFDLEPRNKCNYGGCFNLLVISFHPPRSMAAFVSNPNLTIKEISISLCSGWWCQSRKAKDYSRREQVTGQNFRKVQQSFNCQPPL